jgi:threonine dehydrogenase-like Zn-dependent dehydrogenase
LPAIAAIIIRVGAGAIIGAAAGAVTKERLAENPTRLGHEATVTIVKIGEQLAGQYYPGQRVAVQPDIYQEGMSTAYGHTVPGALIQYHLIGPEVLVTDTGVCLLPLEGDMGYAEAALLEPWGCVMAAYTQRRRLEPKADGIMWLLGSPGHTREYTFSSGLEAPATIVLTDVPASVEKLAAQSSATIITRNGLDSDAYAALVSALTDGRGFDDVVLLDPRSATAVGEIARHVARRGTLNMVGQNPLDGLVHADVGRLHYDYIALLMTPNGMLVFFAGVPNGTLAPLDFSPVYLQNAQFTGTSGLTIEDQAQVMHSALHGLLSPASIVAAVAGMNAAQE